jgi:hypothetical protein
LFSQLGDLEALRAVRDPRIQRPSEIDRTLPVAIDEIVMTALARDKNRRFPSAGALGAKLRSLRYSLDSTVGDPATELAKIIDSTEQIERESSPPATIHRVMPRNEFEASEATVIRIHTADAFSARDSEASVSAARAVIDRFEDEETRLAQFSGDQMRQLRDAVPRDSSESPAATQPRKRTRAPSDEATRAIAPLDIDRNFEDNPDSKTSGFFGEDPPTRLPVTPVDGNTPPHQHFSPNEDTRLFQPPDRRTPRPQPISRDPASHSERSRSASYSQSQSQSQSQSRTNRPPTPPPPAPPTATVSHRAKPPTPAAPIQQVLATTLPGQPPPGSPVALPAPQPPLKAPMPAPYPGWGPPIAAQQPPRDATPTAQDSLDRPLYTKPQPRPSLPRVAGFNNPPRAPKYAFKPWMLVVGAILVAILAFVITRAFIS